MSDLASIPNRFRLLLPLLLPLVVPALPAATPPGAWPERDIKFSGAGRPANVKVYSAGHEDAGTAIPAIVIKERARVRLGPGFQYDTREIPGSFLLPLFVLDFDSRGSKSWILVGTKQQDTFAVKHVYGWMMEDDLLFSKRAVKKEGIYSKGLIITSWRNTSGPEGILEPAPVMLGPGENYGRLNSGLGLFNFYYIYKDLVIGNDRWFLLGSNPFIPNTTRPGDVLLGWVHYARVSRWDTRLAIEINKDNLNHRTRRIPPGDLAKGKGGVRIFDSRRDLDAHLAGRAVEAVAEENTQEKEIDYRALRFPVTGIEKAYSSGAGRVYKIGFIGDQFDEEGEKIADRNTTFENTAKLQNLINDLQGIDLVFVIDATGTMAKYKDAINLAVRKIGDALKRKFDYRSAVDPKVRFSIVLYRDYQNEGKAGDYLVKRLPLTDDLDEVQLFVESSTTSSGGDAYEAFYYGIEYAVRSTLSDQRAQKADMRLMVHITDAGNAPNDRRGLTADKVAKSLLEADFDYYCINTSPAIFPGSAAEALERQVEQIRSAVPETDADVRYFSGTESDEIVKSIEESALRVAEELNRTKAAAKEVAMEGNLIEAKNRYGVRVTQRLTKKMKAYGIDPNIFRRKGVQVFGEGYVSRDDELRRITDQVKEVYLVSRPDLARLEGFLADFQIDGDDLDGLTGIWTKVLKQAVGEAQFDQRKPIIDLMRAHGALSPNSKILRYSLDQLRVMDPEQRSRLYWDLRADQSRLYGLMAERHIKVQLNLDALPGEKLKVVETPGERRIWAQRNDTQYGWIPIVELP